MSGAAQQSARLVKQRALELGFDSAGVADLAPIEGGSALTRWLESGMAGTMRYMHRQAARRREPATIVPQARRAVMVTRNYYQPDPPQAPGTGLVAKYARGPDYHRELRQPLEALADYVRELGGPGTITRWFVDAGAVPERELAGRAGLGWIGKNTMLIDPRRGSFSFIASVFTNLDLALDQPFKSDRCGTCTRCLDACPTSAFPEPRVLDSRRCIAYLTIEHRGEIDPELAAGLGDALFGCDICQDICPWNLKFAKPNQGTGPDAWPARLDLAETVTLSDEDFEGRFGHTALERTGPDGLRRNAAIAFRNSVQPAEGPSG